MISSRSKLKASGYSFIRLAYRLKHEVWCPSIILVKLVKCSQYP